MKLFSVYFEVLVGHLSGNVQQAVGNVGPEKGTWVRAEDYRRGSHSLGDDREN